MKTLLVKLSVLSALVLLVLPAAFAATNSIVITTNGTNFTTGQTLVVSGTITASPIPTMVNVVIEYQSAGSWVVASLAHVSVNSAGQFSNSYILPNNGASSWHVQASYNTGAPKPLGGLVLSNLVYFSVSA